MAFTFVMALLPAPIRLTSGLSPLMTHVVAFTFLATALSLAYPRTNLIVLSLGLTLLGGLIELAQMIPILEREASIRDWLADIIGISIGLFGIHLARHWRHTRIAKAAGQRRQPG